MSDATSAGFDDEEDTDVVFSCPWGAGCASRKVRWPDNSGAGRKSSRYALCAPELDRAVRRVEPLGAMRSREADRVWFSSAGKRAGCGGIRWGRPVASSESWRMAVSCVRERGRFAWEGYGPGGSG